MSEEEHSAEVVPLRASESAGVAGQPAAAPVVYADITGQPGERRPVVPLHLQRENIRATITMWAGLQSHRSRYHGLRLPFYVVALAVCTVSGVRRLVQNLLWWWWLLEQHELRSEAAAAGDAREWRALHREGKQTRKVRGFILLGAVTVLAVGGFELHRYGPRWSWYAVPAAVVPLLAWYGRPLGRRLIAPAIVPPQYEPITQSLVTEALGSLGIANISKAIKDGPGIRYITDPYKDGPGWAVQLDLPQGVTAGDIIAKRGALASGLRRPLSATWPEGVPAEHEGRLLLWVGFSDISKVRPPKWPLLKSGTADVFGLVPFGTDPRQRPVGTPLFELNWLIGASPGQGKTSAVRVLGCSAALDPVCDLWIHELAGKGDLEPLAQVSHRYCSGLDDEAVSYAAASARMLRGELERRSAELKNLPREVRPDGKLTRELAVRLRRLRPVVAVFDEAQNMFLHPELGDDAAADLAHVMRLGRAYGIIIILSTQRPDKDSVPSAISGVVTARLCLKVPDQVSNDMVLGTGSYKSGYNAAMFRAKTDAGLAWLKAEGEPQIIRTYYLDLPVMEKVCARARVMREHAGVLSGYALGLEAEGAAPRDVLADVLAAFQPGEPGQHWDVLAGRLAERWPDRWADLTHTALSAQCRGLGVPSVTVSVGGGKDKGCRRVAVEQALGPAVSAQVSMAGGNQS